MDTLIAAGWTPLWVGFSSLVMASQFRATDGTYELLVKLVKDGKWHMTTVLVDIEHAQSMEIIRKKTDSGQSKYIGLVSGITTWNSVLRAASVMGVGTLQYPIGDNIRVISQPPIIRLMGLDIEQTTYCRGKGFPLPTDPLLSIAIVMNDGRQFCRYVNGYVDKARCCPDDTYDVKLCKDSTEMADWAIELVISECPDFVCIHNGYKYDILVLAAHCSSQYGYLFKEVSLGKDKSGYDFIIEGVTVLDTYHYLSKLHNGDYASFGLDAIAKQLGLSGKIDGGSFDINPDSSDNDLTDMVIYNIYDSYLHIEIAIKSRMIEEVLTLSTVFCCPLNDCTRFISGTMVTTLVAAYAYRQSKVFEWSKDSPSASRYVGGFVMDPIKGLYHNIAVLDFSSLYPSIIAAANISNETIQILSEPSDINTALEIFDLSTSEVSNTDVLLRFNESTILIAINGEVAIIDRTSTSVSVQVMKYLMSSRNALEDRSSPLGWAYKIGANSFYGALGSQTSGIGMRFAAAAVTGLGRLLIENLISFVSTLGYTVIYGDTDSVFIDFGLADIEEGVSIRDQIDGILASFHASLANTIFSTVRLNFETLFDSFLMIGPKMYYGIKSGNSKPTIKGISAKRRDRPQIARDCAMKVANMICTTKDTRESISLISSYLYSVYSKVITKKYDEQYYMLETKDGANVAWKYKCVSGKMVTIEKDLYTPSSSEPVLLEWVIDYIRRSVDTLLQTASLPRFEKMIMEARYNMSDLSAIL